LVANELLTPDQILRRLAEQLDDAVLERIFPRQHPDGIRRILTNSRLEGNRAADLSAPSPPFTEPVKAPAKLSINGRCRLFTDGASRGNPGQAGAGAVLLNEDGAERATRSVYLGICTNNVAEYKALLIGLEEALQQGCSELAVALDSELIVRQIQGRYKFKNEALLPLYQQVRERLARFGKWSIAHVPRAQNARADQLANQGIDQKDS
jgi:ribonuclease HI/probable phosphoglycerate mutase